MSDIYEADDIGGEDELVEDDIEGEEQLCGERGKSASEVMSVDNVYHLKLPYSKERIFATYSGGTTILNRQDKVIVKTRYGLDMADVLGQSRKTVGVKRSEVVEIERIANETDRAKAEELREKEKEAFVLFKEKAASRGLNMKAISVHFMFDGQKALFFFSAESRIDFRELVRDLVGLFRMRIELRQVGSRDEARMMGAVSMCGRPLCCALVTDKMRPVSIRMAKEQSKALNSAKISGHCGRLLCCLSYEFDWYSEARRKLPTEGVRVDYDGTVFRVLETNPISSMVRMLGEDGRMIEVNAKRFSHDASNRWQIE